MVLHQVFVMHCQTPSCVSVCPVKAMTKDPVTGIVDYSKDNCIGCRYCQVACPFNIPKFQWDRTIPRIVKCDLCRETNLKDKGITACAETCPTGAILFGKRAELLRRPEPGLSNTRTNTFTISTENTRLGVRTISTWPRCHSRAWGFPDLQSDAPATFSERIQHTIYKGFIAPVALYTGLCLVAFRNMKRLETGSPEA